jgi:DNA polymerase-3 subunit delta'
MARISRAKSVCGLFDWYQILGVKNKQGDPVDDAQEILKSLALNHEGGYKVMMIIWMADKLNTAAANKLLKLLEEPTGTVFILISENEDIIQTIRFDVKYSF